MIIRMSLGLHDDTIVMHIWIVEGYHAASNSYISFSYTTDDVH